MDINKIYRDCQAIKALIPRITDREQGAINELNRLYMEMFGERVRATCSNCHIKAVHRLLNLTLNDIEIMNNQSFKLKKGVLINWPFRSNQYFNSIGGMPDSEAIDFLRSSPHNIDKFSTYPGSDSETKALDLSLIGIDVNAPVIAPPVTPEITVVDTFEKLKEKYSIVTGDTRLGAIATLKTITELNDLDLSDEEIDIADTELEKLTDEQEAFEIETLKAYKLGSETPIETYEEILDKHSGDFSADLIDMLQKTISEMRTAKTTEPEKTEIEPVQVATKADPVKADEVTEKPINRMNKKELTAAYEKEFLELPSEELTVKELIKLLTKK